MSDLQNLDDLLTAVAELAGLDEVIRVQEDQIVWLLGIDDQDTVLAQWQQATRRMMFTLEIGPLPDRHCEHWLKEVLSYNLLWQQTGGARIGLLPPDNRLQLLFDVHAEQLGASQIVSVLDNLIQVANAWRNTLNADPQASAEQAVDTFSVCDNPNHFIRI